MSQVVGAGIIVFLSGAAIGALFLVMWRRKEAEAGFGSRLKSTEGTLQEIEIVERFRPIGLLPKAGSVTAYDIRCRYDFTVDGQSFTGTGLDLNSGGYMDKRNAKGAIYGLRPGEKVTVWYDPASPGLSVLRHDPPADLGVMKYGSYLAGVASLIGIVIIVVGMM